MTPTKRVQGIIYYKTNRGLLIANKAFNYGTVRSNMHGNCLINDKPLQPTHTPFWYQIDGEQEVLSYKEKVSDTRVLVGFDLKDPSMEIDGKIPAYLSVEEVKQHWDDGVDDYRWENYDNIRPLYEGKFETTVGGYQDVEFEAECLGEVEGDVTKPVQTVFSVPVDSNWSHKGDKSVKIESIAHYSELDRILTPEFAIHNKPCTLSSKQTYDIVRTYIKDNIDPKQAIITSDYEFCFTVKKKVAVKPWVNTTEKKKGNGRSYATPKISKQTVDHKQVQIFEMTHDQQNYKGYSVIKGFSGNNLEDLVETIKDYLEELMSYINCPVSECEHCGGTGHIVDKGFDKNKR